MGAFCMNTYIIITEVELTEQRKDYTVNLKDWDALEQWKFLNRLSGEKIMIIEELKHTLHGQYIFNVIEDNVPWDPDVPEQKHMMARSNGFIDYEAYKAALGPYD